MFFVVDTKILWIYYIPIVLLVAVEALQLIPPETPLRVLAKALNIVLQTTHDEATVVV